MRFSTLLPLVATATTLVVPDAEIMQQIAIEDHQRHGVLDGIQAQFPSADDLKHKFEETFSAAVETSKNILDDALAWTNQEINYLEEEYFDAKGWMASAAYEQGPEDPDHPRRPPPPHHGPGGSPRDGTHPPPPPPPHGPEHGERPHPPPPPHGPDHGERPHHPPPPPGHGPDHGKKPHPPHHKKPHHKSNLTVYELIASSKYTTKLAELINGDKDLVALLNSTDKHLTVFAPTDAAFDKIPEHHKEPSKELIKKVLSYHVSSDFYPAGRILVSRTVPTLLEGKYLSSKPEDTPQRISTNIGLRGLTLNFYSRVVAADIFGKNGVIHGIDSFLIPPLSAARVITLLPSEFSTLELGLYKTGLFDGLNSTSNHLGGTLFAPSNWAFTKLGPKINAFLFSEYGRKYLKALLEYHIVANQTLYSDAFYSGGATEIKEGQVSERDHDHDHDKDHEHKRPRVPRGKFHVDLPTLLKDKYLSIDVGRYGRLIDIRINGFTHVSIADGIVKDGVIHQLNSVLIPPKKPGESAAEHDHKEMTVEDLKERLEAFVKEDGVEVEPEEKHDL